MLCKFRDSFDYDQLCSDGGYKHHAKFISLMTSRKAGCELCEYVLDMAVETQRIWELGRRHRHSKVCHRISNYLVEHPGAGTTTISYGTLVKLTSGDCISVQKPVSLLILSMREN
jgi:hypothetical protein